MHLSLTNQNFVEYIIHVNTLTGIQADTIYLKLSFVQLFPRSLKPELKTTPLDNFIIMKNGLKIINNMNIKYLVT